MQNSFYLIDKLRDKSKGSNKRSETVRAWGRGKDELANEFGGEGEGCRSAHRSAGKTMGPAVR